MQFETPPRVSRISNPVSPSAEGSMTRAKHSAQAPHLVLSLSQQLFARDAALNPSPFCLVHTIVAVPRVRNSRRIEHCAFVTFSIACGDVATTLLLAFTSSISLSSCLIPPLHSLRIFQKLHELDILLCIFLTFANIASCPCRSPMISPSRY